MGSQDLGCELVPHSSESASGTRAVRSKLSIHSPENDRLLFWRRDLRDGTQAPFGKEGDLLFRQIH